jgi:hypothetical protein
MKHIIGGKGIEIQTNQQRWVVNEKIGGGDMMRNFQTKAANNS